MTRLQWTQNFKKDYQALSEEIKKRVKKQLKIIKQNPRHPSLHTKKMNDPREIWEARVTESYRFTFQIEKDIYILRRVGTHDILRNP